MTQPAASLAEDVHSTFSSMPSSDLSQISCESETMPDFYIGETMCEVAVQTVLSTQPQDSLMYSTNPIILLHALMHNAVADLVTEVHACDQHVCALLEAVPDLVPSTLSFEPAESKQAVLEELHGGTSDVAQQAIRLCSLRLSKFQQQWVSLYASIEYENTFWSGSNDDASFSLFLEDACDLFCNIQELMGSTHSSGIWSNGKAVHDVFMASFGACEGKAAVAEHMHMLGIAPTDAPKTILQLALMMHLNGRCDSIDTERL